MEVKSVAAQLNHTIVWSSDQTKSALFLAEMLGRPAPVRFGHFEGGGGAFSADRSDLNTLTKQVPPPPPEAIEKLGWIVGRQPVEAVAPCSQEVEQVNLRLARPLRKLLLERNHIEQFSEKLAMLVGELYARGLALMRNPVQKAHRRRFRSLRVFSPLTGA
jgi:hypothetical protein